jgi:hypothetical protein
LLIQIGDKKYSGKGMDVTALQKISDDVVKIVVKFDDYSGGRVLFLFESDFGITLIEYLF